MILPYKYRNVLYSSQAHAREVFVFEGLDAETETLYRTLDFDLSQLIYKITNHFQLTLTHFVFINNHTPNCFVHPFGTFNVLGLHVGFITYFDNFFKENHEALFSDMKKPIDHISKIYAWEPDSIAFKICLQYVIYHEVGHIIQKTNSQNTSNSHDSARYLIEFDADICAAIQIARNILQVVQKVLCETGDMKLAEQIIIYIISAVATVMWVVLPPDLNYVKVQKNYPHFFIRFLAFYNDVVNYIEASLKSNNQITEDFDLHKIGLESLRVSLRSMDIIYGKESTENAISVFRQRFPEIKKDYLEFHQELKTADSTFMKFWEQYVKSRI